MISAYKKLAICLSLLWTLNSCTSPGTEIDLHDPPEQDKDYKFIFSDSTKDVEVYDNFETRYRIHATYLSPKFRGAFTERLKKLFTEAIPSFSEAGKKAGFFVTIYAPEDALTDLDNEQLWRIFLQLDNQSKLSPTLVKRLAEKERWRPFFPSVSSWTKEYLIIFDTPSITPNAAELVEKKSFRLTFTNADARVHMNW